MIKVKNQKILEEEIIEAVNRDSVLYSLLKILLNTEVVLTQLHNAESENAGNSRYFLLKNDEGIAFAFDFGSFDSNKGNYDYFMRLIAMSSFLKKNQLAYKEWEGFYFAEATEDLKQMKRFAYTVSSQTLKPRSIRVLIPQKFSLFFAGCENLINKERTCDSLSLNLSGITLDTDSFMRLSEGMEIECELPGSFSANLNYEEHNLAGIEASLCGNKLTLRVTKLATSC